jgi:hypothetical protein
MTDLEKLFDNYIMIVMAAHLFSLGGVVLVPIMCLADGNYILSVMSAIIIYPVTYKMCKEF